jgi:23S rRNA (adenine2503-C2)-methyltransferase
VNSILLKDLPVGELAERLAPLGVDARTARRIQAAIVKKRLPAVPDFPEVSPKLMDRVRAAVAVPRLELIEKAVSVKDGFAKYLFRSAAGTEARPTDAKFEAVRIPLLHRPGDEKYIVCVSSQIGCALACAFCETGRLGFTRNLETWEIVDQVLAIQSDSDRPVRGVVFMGMGEPMLNYDRVMAAAAILSEPAGAAIDAKAITISTAGVVPGIRRFTQEKRPYRLVVSLASAEPAKRRELMPIERTHPTAEIIAALRDYHAATGRRVTIAWPLLSGVNTSAEDARQLAELTAGLPMLLDIIDVNDPTGLFRPPSGPELNTFRDALRRELKMPVVRRYSGGGDIAGGCGMLAGRAMRDKVTR